jgi:hypothetical protein
MPEVSHRQFTLAMDNLAMLGEAKALAAAVDLSGCASMADVGCGSGIYSVELCLRYPGLRATLLDRGEVLETASEIVRKHGLENRVETRPRDITTDAYGQDLDVVLLSDVLYQDEAMCMTMLRSAHKALRQGGRLVVRGYYSDPGGSESVFGALFALNVLLGGPAREAITLGKVRDWIREAGFRDVSAFALTGRSSCLMAVK